MVYEVTIPSAHSTNRITQIVQSIFLLSLNTSLYSLQNAHSPKAKRLSRKPVTRYISPQPDGLQKPDTNGNHHDDIQNRLDAGRHGDKPVDQVQRHADHDQGNYKIDQRHFSFTPQGPEEQSAAQSLSQ
jgi:hypothetical protein